jgi:hypothetical protein
LAFLSDTPLISKSVRNNELSAAISAIPDSKKILFYNTIDSIIFLKGDNYSQYLLMPGLFEAGDKNALSDFSNDFILINDDAVKIGAIPSCYPKTKVSKYFLFQKTSGCGK